MHFAVDGRSPCSHQIRRFMCGEAGLEIPSPVSNASMEHEAIGLLLKPQGFEFAARLQILWLVMFLSCDVVNARLSSQLTSQAH
jgi:hypothetical protein